MLIKAIVVFKHIIPILTKHVLFEPIASIINPCTNPPAHYPTPKATIPMSA